MFARGLHRGLEIKSELGAEGKEVSSEGASERYAFDRLNGFNLRLLVMGKEDQTDR